MILTSFNNSNIADLNKKTKKTGPVKFRFTFQNIYFSYTM